MAIAAGEIADESRPWAGGVMCRAGPGNWINYVAGAGFAGEVSREAMAEMIAFYEEKGIEPRIELAPFADGSLVSLCAEHGFVVRVFESVFFRELQTLASVEPVQAPPPGLRIERVDQHNQAALRRFCETAMSGFYPPGMTPTEDEIRTAMRSASHPRSIAVVGYIGDEPAGAGAMELARVDDVPITSLFGLSVRPEFRRRGVQQALIAARLNIAIEHGARLATISSRPGVATERNVRRMGFEVAYTKGILVRPGAGLVGVRT
jgi:ribosomal protein S18 acetylase RimI-like enzyme